VADFNAGSAVEYFAVAICKGLYLFGYFETLLYPEIPPQTLWLRGKLSLAF